MSLVGDGPLSLLNEPPARALNEPPVALAAFGPGATVGVEVDTLLPAHGGETSSDHPEGGSLIVGGSRMRLLRERPSHDRDTSIGIFSRVVDMAVTPARASRQWRPCGRP